MKDVPIRHLRADYQLLINHTLPAAIAYPVQHNHCFARIILDWTFNDCWYNHLHQKTPAYLQLSETQLSNAIERMQAWLQQPQLLVQDHKASLSYRNRQVPQAASGALLFTDIK